MNRRGSSLIEMLVVIAILGVLIGILLPLLNGSVEQARQTECLASLRSLGQATLMYRNDNRDLLPVAVGIPSVFGLPPEPYTTLAAYLETPLPTSVAGSGEAQLIRPFSCRSDEVWGPGTGFSYTYAPMHLFQVMPGEEHIVQRVFKLDTNAALFLDYAETPHRNTVRMDGSAAKYNGRIFLRMP